MQVQNSKKLLFEPRKENNIKIFQKIEYGKFNKQSNFLEESSTYFQQ